MSETLAPLRFCVNCRREQPPGGSSDSFLCPGCGTDPQIPEALMEARLSTFPRRRPFLRDPGEIPALIGGIAVSLFVLVLLGLLTFGWILLGIAIALGPVIHRLVSLRGEGAPTTAPTQSRIDRLARLAAYRLECRLPPIYVVENRSRNAHALGVGPWSAVVLDAALVEDFEDDELLFILGHEIGHVAAGHTVILLATGPFRPISSNIFASLARLPLHPWHHRAEFAADQAGLIACGSAETATRTLARLATGDDGAGEILAERGMEPYRFAERLAECFSTHPFPSRRIARLLQGRETR